MKKFNILWVMFVIAALLEIAIQIALALEQK